MLESLLDKRNFQITDNVILPTLEIYLDMYIIYTFLYVSDTYMCRLKPFIHSVSSLMVKKLKLHLFLERFKRNIKIHVFKRTSIAVISRMNSEIVSVVTTHPM